MRTIIELTEEQILLLKKLQKREGISRAEAIRRAVEDYIKRLGQPAEPEAAFGIWTGRKQKEGVQYQKQLRKEWDAE